MGECDCGMAPSYRTVPVDTSLLSSCLSMVGRRLSLVIVIWWTQEKNSGRRRRPPPISPVYSSSGGNTDWTTMRGAALAHRLLCIPVQGRRLAFHLKAVPLHRKVSSADFVNWRVQENLGMRAVHATQWILYRSIETAEQQWDALEQAPKDAWRGRLYDLVERYLLTYIYPAETLCKAVEVPDPESPDVGYQILHPERYEREEVLSQLRQTLLDAHAYHKKWSFWSGCSLGLTGALFAIPGPPNVPFYWNAFRSYSHYRATRGSHYLLLQLHREYPDVVPLPATLAQPPPALKRPARLQIAPCSELDELETLEEDETIDSDTIEELFDTFSDTSLHAHLRNVVRTLKKDKRCSQDHDSD